MSTMCSNANRLQWRASLARRFASALPPRAPGRGLRNPGYLPTHTCPEPGRSLRIRGVRPQLTCPEPGRSLRIRWVPTQTSCPEPGRSLRIRWVPAQTLTEPGRGLRIRELYSRGGAPPQFLGNFPRRGWVGRKKKKKQKLIGSPPSPPYETHDGGEIREVYFKNKKDLIQNNSSSIPTNLDVL